LVVGPRIEEQNTGRGEVLGVAGHDVEAVAACGGSEEPVACGNDFAGPGSSAESEHPFFMRN